MEFTRSQINALRRWTLTFLALAAVALFAVSAFTATDGAWYIPAGTLLGITATLFWVQAHDNARHVPVRA